MTDNTRVHMKTSMKTSMRLGAMLGDVLRSVVHQLYSSHRLLCGRRLPAKKRLAFKMPELAFEFVHQNCVTVFQIDSEKPNLIGSFSETPLHRSRYCCFHASKVIVPGSFRANVTGGLSNVAK